MSCYHPLIAYPDGKTELGKTRYKIVSSKGVNHLEDVQKYHPEAILVPCGHCIGCRLDYSRTWADRMMLELETSKKAVFLTLTYDSEHAHPVQFERFKQRIFDDNVILTGAYSDLESHDMILPVSYDFVYRDVQLFLKLIRKDNNGKKGNPYNRLRFYCASEFGDETHRPHFHMILFGLGLEDFPDKEFWARTKLNDILYTSEYLNSKWKCGRVILADVSWRTCAYVARYVTKKLSGDMKVIYDIWNCTPEKAYMSRRPGIGAEYLLQHPDCLDMSNINISTPDGGMKIQIPKYYLKFLNKNCLISSKDPEKIVLNPLYNPELYDRIMSEKMNIANANLIIKDSYTGLNYVDYLESEEYLKSENTKILKRAQI